MKEAVADLPRILTTVLTTYVCSLVDNVEYMGTVNNNIACVDIICIVCSNKNHVIKNTQNFYWIDKFKTVPMSTHTV